MHVGELNFQLDIKSYEIKNYFETILRNIKSQPDKSKQIRAICDRYRNWIVDSPYDYLHDMIYDLEDIGCLDWNNTDQLLSDLPKKDGSHQLAG